MPRTPEKQYIPEGYIQAKGVDLMSLTCRVTPSSLHPPCFEMKSVFLHCSFVLLRTFLLRVRKGSSWVFCFPLLCFPVVPFRVSPGVSTPVSASSGEYIYLGR